MNLSNFCYEKIYQSLPGSLVVQMRRFAKSGFRLFLVGGVLRSLISGKESYDIDLALDQPVEKFQNFLRRRKIKFFESGVRFGTIQILIPPRWYEVTHFRTERRYLGRWPLTDFVSDLKEDAKRRDFTCNSLYWSIEEGLLDPCRGLGDVLKRRVRFVGKAEVKIKEDRLRILRLLRFKLSFSEGGSKILRRNLRFFRYGSLSEERIFQEWAKIFSLLNKDFFQKRLSRIPRKITTQLGDFNFERRAIYSKIKVVESQLPEDLQFWSKTYLFTFGSTLNFVKAFGNQASKFVKRLNKIKILDKKLGRNQGLYKDSNFYDYWKLFFHLKNDNFTIYLYILREMLGSPRANYLGALRMVQILISTNKDLKLFERGFFKGRSKEEIIARSKSLLSSYKPWKKI